VSSVFFVAKNVFVTFVAYYSLGKRLPITGRWLATMNTKTD
jgi:hypothetical protein